jgi:hypothetical protein
MQLPRQDGFHLLVEMRSGLGNLLNVAYLFVATTS